MSPHRPHDFLISQAVNKWVQNRSDNGVKYCNHLISGRGMQEMWLGVGRQNGYIKQACHNQVGATSGKSFNLPFA
jgi:hypothetical protein